MKAVVARNDPCGGGHLGGYAADRQLPLRRPANDMNATWVRLSGSEGGMAGLPPVPAASPVPPPPLAARRLAVHARRVYALRFNPLKLVLVLA